MRLAQYVLGHLVGTPMTHPVPSKTSVITLKLTPGQRRLIEERAKRCGVNMSAWMRSILIQAAKRQPMSEGYLRIREPDGEIT
jgi:hypothetical protein